MQWLSDFKLDGDDYSDKCVELIDYIASELGIRVVYLDIQTLDCILFGDLKPFDTKNPLPGGEQWMATKGDVPFIIFKQNTTLVRTLSDNNNHETGDRSQYSL